MGTPLVHFSKVVVWGLLITSLAFALVAAWLLGIGKADIVERDGGVVLERAGCYSALRRTEDKLGLILQGTCSDHRELFGELAARPDLARAFFVGVERLYLGTVSFSVGLFLQCDLLARLTQDRNWTPGIDSLEAGAVLERVLPRSTLVPELSAVLGSAGKSIKSVAIEMVLFDRNLPRPDCRTMPMQIPTSAVIDIELR